MCEMKSLKLVNSGWFICTYIYLLIQCLLICILVYRYIFVGCEFVFFFNLLQVVKTCVWSKRKLYMYTKIQSHMIKLHSFCRCLKMMLQQYLLCNKFSVIFILFNEYYTCCILLVITKCLKTSLTWTWIWKKKSIMLIVLV